MDFRGTDGNDTLDQSKLGIADNSNIFGEAGDDTITIGFANACGGLGNDTIVGTKANAAAVYWTSPKGVVVDLQSGKAQDGFGTVDTLSNIHSIHGSSFSDTLIGSAGDDIFWGGTGNDFIDGGGGVNTVSFFFEPLSKFSITYDATSSIFTVSNTDPNSSNFGTKKLKNIQTLQFQDDGSGHSKVWLNGYVQNYTIDFNGKQIPLSVAGIWTPVSASDPLTHNGIPVANAFYSQITLANGRSGLALDGWAYNGWDNKTFYPVNAAIFEQNADGTLSLATSKYLADPLTNGSGSVLVADFNSDGRQDIFLPAHNESPSIPKSSTAYVSNLSGTFTKVSLTDSVEAHGGVIANFQGIPTVFTGSYGGDGDPYFQFRNGSFVETKFMSPDGQYQTVGGSSVNAADFDGNGQTDLIISDHSFGPGYPYVAGGVPVIAIYKLSDVAAGSGSPELILTPYFNGKPQYANVPNLFGNGTTHEPRLWIDDFNHDGKADVLGSALMWTTELGMEFAILQMFQNTSTPGAISFAEKTDILNSGYNIKSNEVDKAMQIIDFDHSGIASYFQAGSTSPYNQDGTPQSSMQNNYIMLNDGTGKLHTYMHDEFQALGEKVNAYAALSNAGQPRFIEYFTPDGKINLVAEFGISEVISGNWVQRQEFVNVPLQLNPTVDYTKSITVSDRNGSMLMRTWAGSDTIKDTNANTSPAHIDGGLGIDTASYSKAASTYQVVRNSDGSNKVTGNGIADTLVNVERLKFADATIALDVSGTGGQAYRVYQAAFNRTPDAGGVGFWIKQMDYGATLKTVAENFVNSAEFKAVYGANPTNAQIITKFYDNVLHRAGETAGYNFWLGILDRNDGTVAEVLAAFSESAENQAGLVGVIGNGFAYTPFV